MEPSWDDRGSSIWGCLLLFWFRSRTLIVSGLCNALFILLCEVAIVSQLCILFPYILHGLCEDYLTCDIAFNAVMPLSRASTRGRYSRIEGVTPAQHIFVVDHAGDISPCLLLYILHSFLNICLFQISNGLPHTDVYVDIF